MSSERVIFAILGVGGLSKSFLFVRLWLSISITQVFVSKLWGKLLTIISLFVALETAVVNSDKFRKRQVLCSLAPQCTGGRIACAALFKVLQQNQVEPLFIEVSAYYNAIETSAFILPFC